MMNWHSVGIESLKETTLTNCGGSLTDRDGCGFGYRDGTGDGPLGGDGDGYGYGNGYGYGTALGNNGSNLRNYSTSDDGNGGSAG